MAYAMLKSKQGRARGTAGCETYCERGWRRIGAQVERGNGGRWKGGKGWERGSEKGRGGPRLVCEVVGGEGGA